MSDSINVPEQAVEQTIAVLPDYVSSVDVAPNGQSVAASSASGHVCISDMRGGVQIFEAHQGDVVRVKWSLSGSHIGTCGIDGAVRIWNTAGSLVAEARHPGWATDIAWRPSGEEVAATIGRRVVRLLANGLKSVRHNELKATAECLAWSDDGRRLFVGHYGGVTMFQGAPEPVKNFPWKGAPLVVAPSPDGKWLVSGNQDASLHVWKIANGDELQMTGFATKVQSIAWRRDGLRLSNASMNEISEWDFSGKGPKGSKPIGMVGHSSRIVGLGYSPVDESILGSVATDGSICLWRPVKSGRSLMQVHQTHRVLSAMAWSPTTLSMVCATPTTEVSLVMFDGEFGTDS